MESFILELGVGFCFVARQQRMQIDDRDYYLDLLFYHRKLRRLIAIDLKIGQFGAADKGQMELYLGWLKRYAIEPEESAPLGMILCAGKSTEHIALLELQKSGTTWRVTGRSCYRRRNWSVNSTRRCASRGRGWRWPRTEHAQAKKTAGAD